MNGVAIALASMIPGARYFNMDFELAAGQAAIFTLVYA